MTTEVLVDTLNGRSSSSSSSEWNPLLAGPVDPAVNRSCDMLQGRAPHPEDNQFLGGSLPEKSGWSIRTDGVSTPSLPPPPPIDISSLPNPNGFFWPDADGSFWPPFQRDTHWQLDFDLPFTTEPDGASAGAYSSALSELDLSQLYDRSTRGCDSAGISREMIEYLSLGEKVSTDARILA